MRTTRSVWECNRSRNTLECCPDYIRFVLFLEERNKREENDLRRKEKKTGVACLITGHDWLLISFRFCLIRVRPRVAEGKSARLRRARSVQVICSYDALVLAGWVLAGSISKRSTCSSLARLRRDFARLLLSCSRDLAGRMMPWEESRNWLGWMKILLLLIPFYHASTLEVIMQSWPWSHFW